ncbi:MAG: DUF309 domain-containing protein [Acidobacteriota bacterium]
MSTGTVPEIRESDMAKAVAEFNSGRYFECHDTLEALWHGMRGEARDAMKGLIQVAVGFYHLRAGNARGAESQLGKALGNLDASAAIPVDLATLRDGVAEILALLDRDPGAAMAAPLPSLAAHRAH